MEPDVLFLGTLDDLEKRLQPGASEYDVLMIAALLRKLLLDASPLMDLVNKVRRLQIRFRANCGGPPQYIVEDGATFWSQQDGFDPETGMPRRVQPSELRRDALLRCVVMMIQGQEISVHELIDVAAHIDGAVHAGVASTAKEHAMTEVGKQLQIGGMAPATRSLLAIGRVVLRGLEPLRTAIQRASNSPTPPA